MTQTMELRSWTAEQWATAAGMPPTNITRFLRHRRFVPTTRTLVTLAAAAGVSLPPELTTGTVGGVPLLNEKDLVKLRSGGTIDRLAQGRIRVSSTSSHPEAFAVEVDVSQVETVAPGDRLICLPPSARKPRATDIVIEITAQGILAKRANGAKQPLATAIELIRSL